MAPLDAGMVNEYLRHITGGDYTAKDFRAWKGTASAGMPLAGEAEMPARQRILEAIRQSAELLGNTPTVARAAYVDPRIVDGFLAGDLERLKATESEIAGYLASLP